MITCLIHLMSIIQAVIPVTVDYNPYSMIVNWNYNVVDTTDNSSDCDAWKILDIKITDNSWNKEYIFLPTKDSNNNINSYDDWTGDINKDNCIKELKKNYSGHFDDYVITNDWINLNDGNNNTIIIGKDILSN